MLYILMEKLQFSVGKILNMEQELQKKKTTGVPWQSFRRGRANCKGNEKVADENEKSVKRYGGITCQK